ncbi:hypothetical protein NM208_g4816 [Fusarium decemcellulare]|uniref:Uncharacterized protein n=1 Tax=Fusarium decemcellulare TaxID=57161 RepID=A0ACC1SJH2_9HYPO|nr:hypothetical protein NM208_g4816 [Fusarium decemcellulare]
MMVAVGFGLANWVGYAGAFASGSATWRIPLAMQIPFPALLTVAVLFVPYSPRWLIMQDRIEEAKQVLLRLHGGDADGSMLVAQEIIQIQEQLHLEQQQQQGTNWVHALKAMFSRQYVRRTATAAFIVVQSQLSGAPVIQNYQTIFYAMVGFTGRKSLLISGVYGMMAVIGGAIYLLFVADKWPRARTMGVGSFILAVNISICMALSARYGDGSAGSEDGARAAIAFIFIFSAVFAIFFNSMIWVVPSELFPMFLRSKGLAFAVFSKSVTAIVLSQVTPIALADVGWRFYALFISTNVAAGVLYFFFLPETGGKSLEEIAELFGDALATGHIDEIDVRAKNEMFAEEIEMSRGR